VHLVHLQLVVPAGPDAHTVTHGLAGDRVVAHEPLRQVDEAAALAAEGPVGRFIGIGGHGGLADGATHAREGPRGAWWCQGRRRAPARETATLATRHPP